MIHDFKNAQWSLMIKVPPSIYFFTVFSDIQLFFLLFHTLPFSMETISKEIHGYLFFLFLKYLQHLRTQIIFLLMLHKPVEFSQTTHPTQMNTYKFLNSLSLLFLPLIYYLIGMLFNFFSCST